MIFLRNSAPHEHRRFFTEGRSAEDWQKWIWEQSCKRAAKLNVQMPDYESFREAGFYKSPDLKEDRIFLSDFFKDPDKNPLKTPSGKIEIFSRQLIVLIIMTARAIRHGWNQTNG